MKFEDMFITFLGNDTLAIQKGSFEIVNNAYMIITDGGFGVKRKKLIQLSNVRMISWDPVDNGEGT